MLQLVEICLKEMQIKNSLKVIVNKQNYNLNNNKI